MARIEGLFLLLALSSASADNSGILNIDYPNIFVEAVENGSVTVQSGDEGSVYMVPGPGGTVYYEGQDLVTLFTEVQQGLPPVWKEHSSVGFFSTFRGKDTVNVKLEALDPDNTTLSYMIVAGNTPPGIRVDSAHSAIVGVAPDTDAIYSFTIRATNQKNKSADAVFRMEIIETNQCLRSPCSHGGACINTQEGDGFICNCTKDYGGSTCNIACASNALGVANRSKIPDAQLSGFLNRDGYPATGGRLGASGYGWCGNNRNSWLQVDLGQLTRVFGVAEQSYSGQYYTGSYYLSYSDVGQNFTFVTDHSSNRTLYSGSSSSSITRQTLASPVEARFIRFHPYAYSTSYFPCMRVEAYGCPVV